MRTLEGSDRVKVGLIGLLILVMVVAVGQSFASVPMLFAKPMYYAEFADAAGSMPGDKVRISGMDVGEIKSLEIDGDRVLVGFVLGDHRIGSDSRLSIRTDTILGKRVMEIDPRGSQPLAVSGTLALEQSTTPYQLYDAFSDLTTTTAGWDLESVKKSLNVLSETLDSAAPELKTALDGVARFSDTIGKRDEEFKSLLAQANKVAAVLGDRSEQVNRLLVNAQVLVAAVNERGQAIDYLLSNVSAVSRQFEGFINDNPNLNHVLEQLRVISTVLEQHKDDLAYSITTASKFMGALAEAIGSGPFFKTLVVNLLPYQMIQPFVDAAFKKRGIDPEEFWRNAGLPAFRYPDPNGTPHGNGAPPAAPDVLEGTPEFPGPAVPPGHPCSYTPPAGNAPSPGNPLPCAGLDMGPYGQGQFGPMVGVQNAPPNPAALAPNHGVPAAAIPGLPGPLVPGAPGPALAPGPPGARTVPIAPPSPGPDAAVAPLDMGGS
ncbi:MAG TPA: MCE family protein [Mycobacterium sp.]|nr:MCE family protein [Mycobacterium sp.]